LFDRLPAQVARQAITRHPLHGRQIRVDACEDFAEPPVRQRHRIAIGEKNPPYRVASGRNCFDLGLDVGERLRPEALLWLGVHLAECAFVP